MISLTPIVNWADVAADLQTIVSGALTAIIPVAVALFGVVLGWRFVRRLIGR